MKAKALDIDCGKDVNGSWLAFRYRGVWQCMRWIEPGEFLMGSQDSEMDRCDDEQQHHVIITKGFWLADTTCTQALWQAVMGTNPSLFKGDNRPVEFVSWYDVQEFIGRLNELATGHIFRLPTEAEWEYACRSGTTTPFWFGWQIATSQVNYNGNYPYNGGNFGEYRGETVDVKALPCNSWGLYQMHGNVWEWCQDLDGSYPTSTVIDPVGPIRGVTDRRVARGGCWNEEGKNVRSAYRCFDVPDYRYDDMGFRIACERSHQAGR